MTDTLLIASVKLFQLFLRSLPESGANAVGILMGRAAFLFLGTRRKIAVSNVRRISPAITETDAVAVARRCFEKLGINFVETLLFPYVPKDEYDRRFRMVNRGHVETALSGNRGILALVFHYSNWEIMGVTSFLLEKEIIALARPLKKHRRLNDFLNRLRTTSGLTVIPNRDSARDVMRFLKENRIVALLGDQREKRSKGVWVEFFGQKVPTSKGIVAIAMKTGSPVIPVYSRREGFLRYTIVYNKPLVMERRGAPIDELIYRNTRRINAFLEELVRENPDEWFLVHRRWGRRRAGGGSG